jgi:hypothetical protein
LAATSAVEVTNISRHGFWLWLDDRELFLAFTQFPWFVDAPAAKIIQVERPSPDHLYWPELDVDLSVRSIEHPEEFPLTWRAQRPAPPPPRCSTPTES